MAQDFGIKISKPFRDAQTAADYDLLFNSSWPSLPVAYEGNVEMTITAAPVITSITHDLDFLPFTMYWVMFDDIVYDVQLASITSSTAETDFIDRTNYNLSSDKTATVHFKCFNIDITVNKEYPLLRATGVDSTYDPDYGVRLVRQGKDINSTDLRDYIMHSKAQSPAILSVVTEKDVQTSGGTTDIFQYVNEGGYTAWCFGYGRDTTDQNKWVAANLYGQSEPRLVLTNDTTFRLATSSTANGGSLIVLRDPLFTSTDRSVTY